MCRLSFIFFVIQLWLKYQTKKVGKTEKMDFGIVIGDFFVFCWYIYLIRKMRGLSIILLLSVCLFGVSCWWDQGHMLVSHIADKYLTNTNRQAARDKLFQLVQALNGFTDGRSNSFMEAAVWADDIKEYGATIFDNYHFTNIVYDPDFTFSGMTSYQQDVNAINIINWCLSILKHNLNGISFERAFMARYLLHLVGDIHQPLHSTLMFNATYKTGDLGGNLIKMLTPAGASINLHSYFDSIALEQDADTRINRPLNDTFRKTLQDQAEGIMSKYPADSLKDLVAIKDPKVWGVQSYKIAVDKIYSYTSTTNQITDAYQSEMRPILQRQIALGGYRLGEAIASIFS